MCIHGKQQCDHSLDRHLHKNVKPQQLLWKFKIHIESKIIYKGFLKIDIHIFSSFSSLRPFFLSGSICHRAVNPQHLQILRIDKEGMIDDIITHSKWHHLYNKYLLTLIAQKGCYHCKIWPDWFTSHQSHHYNNYYYDGIPEFMTTLWELRSLC